MILMHDIQIYSALKKTYPVSEIANDSIIDNFNMNEDFFTLTQQETDFAWILSIYAWIPRNNW